VVYIFRTKVKKIVNKANFYRLDL